MTTKTKGSSSLKNHEPAGELLNKRTTDLAHPTRAGRVKPIDIERLDAETIAAVGEMLEEGESANTRTSYASAARYWMAWFGLRYQRDFEEQRDLPLPPEVVVQFIVDHARRLSGVEKDKVLRHELPAGIDRELVRCGVKKKPGAMAINTLEHRLAAMAKIHRNRNLDSPTDHQDVRRLLRAVRSAYARRGDLPKKKDAFTLDRLERLLQTCDASPAGVRDRALLLFAFDSGGRRRSEIAGADLSMLKRDGEDYVFTLAFSKTNQAGTDRPENQKPVVGDAAQALRAWLDLLITSGMNLSEGPVFRRIRRGGHIGSDGLSDDGIWEIVAKRCALASLNLEGHFSAHSLRSGYMTEAGRSGVPLNDAMAFSGHRDVKTAMGYMRVTEMKKSKAAGLASRGKKQRG
ncbi:MAG: site-specific integrase [Burkholderiaceae bacterium]|nr:MAG: site-specific integrase [Burkholderiaceae bacterium]TBR76853.1 MAG: site-specific integrase [Burkholderiaceae bacterium]